MDGLHSLIGLYVARTASKLPAIAAGVPKEGHMKIGSYAKAVVAALAAGSGSLFQAMGDSVITPGEWVTVGLAVLAALGITAVVPNAEKSEPRQRY